MRPKSIKTKYFLRNERQLFLTLKSTPVISQNINEQHHKNMLCIPEALAWNSAFLNSESTHMVLAHHGVLLADILVLQGCNPSPLHPETPSTPRLCDLASPLRVITTSVSEELPARAPSIPVSHVVRPGQKKTLEASRSCDQKRHTQPRLHLCYA